ncbi:hypothetical protein Bca4012_066136 [Brassica carinata]
MFLRELNAKKELNLLACCHQFGGPFHVDGWWGTIATTSIFVAASITDWLNGYLAHKKSKRDDSAKTMSQRLQGYVVVTREQELVLRRGDPLKGEVTAAKGFNAGGMYDGLRASEEKPDLVGMQFEV